MLVPVPLPPAAAIRSAVMLRMLRGTFEHRVKAAALAGMQSVGLSDEYALWSDAEARHAWQYVDSFGMRVEIVAEGAGAGRAIAMAGLMNCPYVLRQNAEADDPHVRLYVDARKGKGPQNGWEAAALVVVDNQPEQALVYRALTKAGYHNTVAFDYDVQGDAVASLKKAVDGFRGVINERVKPAGPTEGSLV